MQKTLCVVVPLFLGTVATGALAQVNELRDKERIIDVAKLGKAIREATEPIEQRMKETDLLGRFDEVNELLQEDDVDKEQLIASLRRLESEMNSFVGDWESSVAAPLWRGQEAIGDTIARVRALLASGVPGEPSGKTKALLENYDQRLSKLAQQIRSESDPRRKDRLRLVFGNTLSLRNLSERASRINLGPASEAVHVKIVHALSQLESALTVATFQIEKARVILSSEADFVASYVGILEGLVEAEQLAKMLGDLSVAGKGIGALGANLGELEKRTGAFARTMESFAERLAESIEVETAQISTDVEGIEFEDLDIDAEIARYAGDEGATNGSN
jgi:hypothetical protein